MIQILPSDVIDQIAAGEVVERPSHLIKELLENCIDAKATRVELEFTNGGKFVRITDNGVGMSPEDLMMALERHATSKISQTNDLWNLHTFGFRGEALASIAAVSRMTITTKTKDAASGSRLVSEFGKKSKVENVSHDIGTTIVIDDLFVNVPARLKFLKSDASESVQIKNVFKALAMAHPEVEFRMMQNSELVYLWPKAASRVARAEQVLEVKKLYEGVAERNGIKAHTVFSDPNTTAKTSKQIWIFAQNRWIQDRSLQAAITEAYRNLLMHGEYPIAVTWVESSPSEIDVNIHPTKSQVKFVDPQSAFRAVHASVRDNLEKAPWVSDIIRVEKAVAHYSEQQITRAAEAPLNLSFQDQSLNQTFFKQKTFTPPSFAKSVDQANLYQAESMEAPAFIPVQTEKPQGKWSSLQVLGQAHLTYIVGQSHDAIIFVDQHAAHERVAFERLMKAWQGGRIDVQDYLFPLTIDLSPEKVEALQTKFEDLKKLGIYCETMGPSTVGVKSAPLLIKESIIAQQIEKLASDLSDKGDSFLFEKVIGDICATLACHSVVRAGQALSLEQMKTLLQEMDEFPLSSFCPHGRPVYVEYPFQKLEKDFGRIN